MQDVIGHNQWDAVVVAIQVVGALLTTIIGAASAVWAAKAAREATAAKVAAVDSVQQTVEGNQKVEEVHKVVNGKNDALVAEVQRLTAENARLQAEAQKRRVGDL